MLEIFICEDDESQRKQITEFIKNYIIFEDLDMKIVISTDNPQEVVDYLRLNKVTGLYFFDVDLEAEINGIELAWEIRKYDKKGALVFITSHPEFMALTFKYKVEAMDYLAKKDFDLMKKEIIACIEMARERLQQSEQRMITIKIGTKISYEPVEHIYYFETSHKKHQIIMYGKGRRLEFYGTLSELENIDDCLIRCHRSFIFNKQHAHFLDTEKMELVLKNGSRILVSRRYLKQVMKELEIKKMN